MQVGRMRWSVVVAVLLAARLAHADCDAEPRTDYSFFLGVQDVINRPSVPTATDHPFPLFVTVGGRWELGAEFLCDPTHVRVSFAASVRTENNRAVYYPDVNPEAQAIEHTDAKLQLGGGLEIQADGPWWVHVGAEKVVGTGYELALGTRIRSADAEVAGVDLVVTTPACSGCAFTPSIGVMVSGGLEGRSNAAAYVSVGVMVVVAVLGGVGYMLSNCDC